MRIIASLCSLTLALPVSADSRCANLRQRVVVQHHAAVVAVKQAVIAPIAVAAFTPVVSVPQYSAGYADHSGSSEVRELKQAILELRQAIQGMQQGGAPGQPPPANDLESRAVKILSARCASCHNETTAASKGGKFLLFKGGQPNQELDLLDVMHVAQRAVAGSMPPQPMQPIPDEEAQVLHEWANSKVIAARTARKQQVQPPAPQPEPAKP